MLIFLFSIISCKKNTTLYHHYLEIPSGIWDRNTELFFTYKNTQQIESALVTAQIRYSEAYPYNGLPLKIETTTPRSTNVQTYNLYVPVFDTLNNKNLGTGMGDVWDLKHVLFENISLTDTGTYTFKIQQQTSLQKLPFVVDVGLEIEKK